jgi:hypothetical protein
MGELYLALLTTPPADRKGATMLSLAMAKYTNKSAEGWGGDRLVLLGRGEERWVQLVTVWDTAKDADEFAQSLNNPGAIPLHSGAERTAEKGWRLGWTPTDVSVSRETAAGDKACVIVRVYSFAKPVKEADVAKLSLPWSIAPPKSK